MASSPTSTPLNIIMEVMSCVTTGRRESRSLQPWRDAWRILEKTIMPCVSRCGSRLATHPGVGNRANDPPVIFKLENPAPFVLAGPKKKFIE